MASNSKDQDGMTRRDFTARVGAAAAGLATRRRILPRVCPGQTTAASSAPTTASSTASIGVRGQGNALKQGFARLKNVEIKTLCDIDANLEPSRVNDKELADVPTFKPSFVQDLRRVLDDKDVDAVVIATPNHWHALATIWALAGRQARLRREAGLAHRSGKAAGWSKRRRATARSCRSAP